eukprot:7381245-Prymnesium_polylepis.1
MVQVSRVSQWRFEDEEFSANEASPSNRRNNASGCASDPVDLKWKPGLSRAEAKVRAKEMRKFIAERSERREANRAGQLKHSPSPPQQPEPNQKLPDAFVLPPPAPPPVLTPAAMAQSTSIPLHDLLPSELWCRVLAELAVRELVCAAAACTHLRRLAADGELWAAVWERQFGRAAQLQGHPLLSELASTRQLCVASEAALTAVCRAAPTEIPLPGMTSVSLAGEVGVSCHDGKMVRLWEARTGRRIAAAQHRHKHTLTCCEADGATGRLAVGDSSGRVHLYQSMDELQPSPPWLANGGEGAHIAGLLLWPRLVVAATTTGHLTGFDPTAALASPPASWNLQLEGGYLAA